MKQFKLLLGILTVGFYLLLVMDGGLAQDTKETVEIDGGLIVNHRTVVPMRIIFEELGATVHWESSTKTITAVKNETIITLKIDSQSIVVNGEKKTIDVPAQIYNGRTYVPVRFISESLGAQVNWNNSLQIATILTSTKAIVVNVNNQQPKKDFSIYGIEIGDDKSEVIATVGEPVNTYKSEYGFTWYVYHNHYKNYFQVGIESGKVVALYTNHDLIRSKKGVTLQSSKTDVRNNYGSPLTSITKGTTKYIYDTKGEHDLYLIDDYYTTIFYDVHQSSEVSSIQLIAKQVEYAKKGFYGKASTELRESFEIQLFDVTNAVRVKFGYKPLEFNKEVSQTARAHSQDMASNNYFAHTNLLGLSPFERMEKDGISYVTAGENIAMGQYSSIFAHEGLMNSKGHRQNILSSRFTSLGIGVSFRENIPYFTQNFITP